MKFRASPDDNELFAQLLDPALVDNVRDWIQCAIKWGEPDTPLHNIKEPRAWQIEEMEVITDFLRAQKRRLLLGDPLEVHNFAHSGGRGGGKTAWDMLIAYWFFSTRLGATVIACANKEDQLKLNTWPELGVWHTLSYNRHWFDRGIMDLKPVPWFRERIQSELNIDTGYYQFSGELWDEHRPWAFAGKHNRYGLLVTIQEATGLPASVLNVIKGFYTDKTVNRILLMSSNPRLNTGPFFEAFHKNASQWRTRITDSRTVEGVDVKVCQAVIDEHGIDSPEACAEVTGGFPSEAANQFISKLIINDAAAREIGRTDPGAPTFIGVDVAREGHDSSVIQVRKGRDARSIPPIELSRKTHGGMVPDNVTVAGKVAEVFAQLVAYGWKPRIAVDVGAGTGVIDVLRSWGYKVTEVNFGSGADDEKRYANRRAEMYGRLKAWLPQGCIANIERLKNDLSAPTRRFSQKGDGGAIILESKDEMQARGLPSPDFGDALALTFAVAAPREDLDAHFSGARPPATRIAVGTGESPFDN